MIHIVVEGPEQSGKSHAIALVGKHLRELGLEVTIQSESSHNAPYLAMSTEELVDNLTKTKIVLTGLRTT